MKYLLLASMIIFGILLGVSYYTDNAQGATPKAGDTKVNSRDDAVMVWIPAGEFLMGTTDDEIAAVCRMRTGLKAVLFADEKPQHKVILDGYWMYKYEVTAGQFRKFSKATGHAMPAQPSWSKDDYPVVNIGWQDAVDYAEWAGGRLPTEAEWEKAARGTDVRRFPWGDAWDEEKCNNYSDHSPVGGGYQGKRATPVGSYPTSISPYGVHDMAGNVWEWCQDWYAADYYTHSPTVNPRGPEEGEFRVLRGGSWGSSSVSIRTTGRHADSPEASYHDDGGFRCVVPASK